MEISFQGKRALVTGAGKGVGRGVALKLSKCGAEVVAVSRTQSDLDELTKTIPNIQTVFLDVADWNKTKTAIEKVGPVDLLVNNAAISAPYKLFGEFTQEETDRIIDINVKSIINISQLIATGMKERGRGGAVVNVSSIMSLGACPTRGLYAATKGAVDQLTRSMAVEFGPHNIRVNSVNPTIIRTRMAEWAFEPNNERGNRMMKRTPLGRFCGDVSLERSLQDGCFKDFFCSSPHENLCEWQFFGQIQDSEEGVGPRDVVTHQQHNP